MLKGREEKNYSRLGDIAVSKLVKKIRRWYVQPNQEDIPADLNVSDVVENLIAIGYLQRKKKNSKDLVLKVDRSRYIIFLNRLMMLQKDDQEQMIAMLHEEIKLLLQREDALAIDNLRGIYGKSAHIMYV